MRTGNSAKLGWEEARARLGVQPGASDEAVRAAYLEKVRQHPPDREPEQFERIRDAYEQLRDPALRARQVLDGPDPTQPLPSLLDGIKPARCFVGVKPWLDVLKENRS